ncbi:MAG: hypothetical protein V7603_642 [Micromonosporaceae bacterium]
MGISASLSGANMSVVPGQAGVCQLTVLNTDDVVERVSIEVLGDLAAYSTVEPSAFSLRPQQSATVTLTVQPPRSPEVPAGQVPLAVRVRSLADPEGVIVEDGPVTIEAFSRMSTTIIPTKSRGRRRGVHTLTVVNHGNVPLGIALRLVDPEDSLTFRAWRKKLVVPTGEADKLRIRVGARNPFLRGPERRWPFQLVVVPEDGDPAVIDAELVQQPRLAPWVVPVAAAACALTLVAVTLWYSVLRPTIRSAATQAVDAQMPPLTAEVEKAREQARVAASAAAAAADKSGGPLGKGSGSEPSAVPTATPSPVLDNPIDYRIQADARPRTDNRFVAYSVRGQSARPLDVTDIQLQNPAGDQGTIEIRRNRRVWLRFGLENFRDYDNHFVVPVRFDKGEVVTLAVSCRNPGGKHCTPALTFSGHTTG